MVKLSELVEKITSSEVWTTFYLDRETDRIHPITNWELHAVEKERSPENPLRSDPELLRIARALHEGNDRYIRIPGRSEVNEYSIMEGFCPSYDDYEISQSLHRILQGRLGMRRFLTALNRFGVFGEWSAYLDKELRFFAKQWCEKNDIDFDDDW